MKKSPPNLAQRFLHWFCRDDYLEEIEGNLLELYERQYEESPRKPTSSLSGTCCGIFGQLLFGLLK